MADAKKDKLQATRLHVTGRLSFARLFKPEAFKEDGDDKAKKYSTIVLIDKKDKAQVTAIKKAFDAANVAYKDVLKGKKILFEDVVHDGDEKADERPEYAGMWYVNAKSTTKPGVLNQKKEVADEDEIYSGMYAIVSINFYAHSKPKPGIAVGLGNVLKKKDGERLAGGISAEDDFADIDLEDEDISEDIEDEDGY